MGKPKKLVVTEFELVDLGPLTECIRQYLESHSLAEMKLLVQELRQALLIKQTGHELSMKLDGVLEGLDCLLEVIDEMQLV